MVTRREDTRARIEAAARALFVRRGPRRTSITQLCALAGVSRATLYGHVRSKDELELVFVRAHLRATRRLLDALARSDAPLVAKLGAVLQLKDEMFDAFGERWLRELAAAKGAVGAALAEGRADVALAIERLLAAERRRGAVRRGLTQDQLRWLWRAFEQLLASPSLAELLPSARARERFLLAAFFGAISPGDGAAPAPRPGRARRRPAGAADRTRRPLRLPPPPP